MHHYLLREWLASAGINPDLDVQLVTIPPSQVAEHMNRQYIDGFCVGEPWNMLALRKGYGTVVAATVDILPNHPEKVLAVGRGWAGKHPTEVKALVRAILKACAYCEHPANFRKLAELLSRPHYLNAPADIIEASLAADRSFAVSHRYKVVRPDDWQIRSFSTAYTFPSATHPAWMMEQMIRWGHLAQDTDLLQVAQRCVETGPYRAAAASIGIECPDDDFPPLPLRGGRVYDARIAQQSIPVDFTGSKAPT